MSAHTPGPWITRKLYGVWEVHSGNFRGPNFITELYPRDEAEANAALIAAAPDMLEAGTDIDRFLLVIESAVRNADPSLRRTVLAALQANRAAIAKAEEGWS